MATESTLSDTMYDILKVMGKDAVSVRYYRCVHKRCPEFK